MPAECLPGDAGLIAADAFGGAIIPDALLRLRREEPVLIGRS
jgi:hypothetical protein